MEVKEYALHQLHWKIREDPWVRAVMTAGGVPLDDLAERLIVLFNQEDFSKINDAQATYYEKLLAVDGTDKTLEERRSSIRAAWMSNGAPTMEMIQIVCDAWKQSEVVVSYTPGSIRLTFRTIFGVPLDITALKIMVERIIPAHIVVDYDYRFWTLGEIHQRKTLAQMNAIPLNQFKGGVPIGIE